MSSNDVDARNLRRARTFLYKRVRERQFSCSLACSLDYFLVDGRIVTLGLFNTGNYDDENLILLTKFIR